VRECSAGLVPAPAGVGGWAAELTGGPKRVEKYLASAHTHCRNDGLTRIRQSQKLLNSHDELQENIAVEERKITKPVTLCVRACTVWVSDGAGGKLRGRQWAAVLQLFAESDRTSLHPARRQAVLHPVLRTAVRQQVRGVQTGDWNRLQGRATRLCCDYVVEFIFGVLYSSGRSQWRRGGGGGAAAPGGTLQGTAFEGRKFGILAFALQCVSVSLYLFII